MEADVNRNIEEQLSAFLDGELRKEELELLVRRLERDNQYRATLARYSLIGNIVRKDPVQTFPRRFRAGVMDAIAVDDAPSAPPVAAAKQLPFFAQWKMPLVSAAAVMLLFAGLANVGLLDNVIGSVDQVPQVADAGELANPNPAAPAAFANEQPQGAVRVRQATLDPQRLTSYMVSHREYSKPLHAPIANSRIVVQQVRFEQ